MKKKIVALVGAMAGIIFYGSVLQAADTATVTINAEVRGTCQFRPPKSTTINLNLDPASGQNVQGEGTLQFACTKGTQYNITDDDGQYEKGIDQPRVKHQTENEYIAYTFSYTPASGAGQGFNNPITLNISVNFAYNDYADARVGLYTDTVTLTINP